MHTVLLLLKISVIFNATNQKKKDLYEELYILLEFL